MSLLNNSANNFKDFLDAIKPYLNYQFYDMSGQGVEANNFSTDEKVIGTWIDGKPLYQKTVNCGALPNSTVKAVNHNVSNIDKVCDIFGFVSTGDQYGTNYPLLFRGNDSFNDGINLYSDRNNIIIYTNKNYSNMSESYVTLKYTKTTDTAVASGEKIVGQWIDGKPVYEKNYVFSKEQISSGEFTLNHDINNVDKIWFDASNSFVTSSTNSIMWGMSAWNGQTPVAYGFFGVRCKPTKTAGLGMYIGTGLYDLLTASDSLNVRVRYTKTS